jgi:hypothetical protein
MGAHINQPTEPGRYIVGDDGVAVKQKPPSPQILDGRVVIYGQPHSFRGQTDVFEKNCFEGSLFDVFMEIDHRYTEKTMGTMEEGTLELYDDDVALNFRLHLQPGHIERLDGRSEASAAYVVHASEMRKGVRHITRASLFEISAVHVGSERRSHCIVRDASTVGTLEHDSKNCFRSDGSFTKVMAALKRLQ